jgi:L-threonylcarbamoyladenylate synthase
VGIESTILGFEDGQPVVYRMGGLGIEQIESVIGKVQIRAHAIAHPKAPGQLGSHYSPRKKLVLGNISDLLKKYGSSDVGILSWTDPFTDVKKENQIVLSPRGSLEEAAQKLFSALREFDKMTVDIILAEEVPDIGLGKAVNDRLRRAAAGS